MNTDSITISREEYDFLVSVKTILNAIYAYAIRANDAIIADDIKVMVESMEVLPWGNNIVHIGGKP